MYQYSTNKELEDTKMQIVIDGCDGVGKSTLAKSLVTKYDLGFLHFTSEDKQNYIFYDNILKKKNYVYDRGPLSELVYPYVFKRKAKMSMMDVVKLVEDNKQTVFIILIDQPNKIIKRMKDDEYKEVKKHSHYINNKFAVIGFELGDYPNVMTFDVTDKDSLFSDVERTVLDYYETY